MEKLLEARTILDIGIITLIIYAIYRTLHATGTWKIALGLTLAALLAGIAKVAGLQGTEWIFSKFSPIALLMLLIIFQPEIRRILERSFFFDKFRDQAGKEELPVLVDEVLFDLAARKWGALLVFPGKIPLQQWTTEGVRLEGLLSKQLLLSLFDNGSPGHDGAALITSGRIERFAVHLPLSQTGKLSNFYGTRHNAALGLAEKTDALVFVVSEERGVVSACRDGNLSALDKRGEAERIIREHFAQHHVGGGISGRKKMLPAFGEFAASFGIAILLWATLILPKTEIREMLFTVPIEYTKEKSLLLTEKLPEAKLLLEGSIAALQALDSSQIRVQVDLTPLPAGRHLINMANENVSVPKRFKVVDIDPGYFNVELKRVVVLPLPIKPQIVGTLPPGYALTKVEISPPSVAILGFPGETGPASLTTTPIYLSGLRESTAVYCKIIGAEGLQFADKKISDVVIRLSIEKSPPSEGVDGGSSFVR